MSVKILTSAAAVYLAFTFGAGAQGVVNGVEDGAREGNRAAGPVGGVVGGVLGGIGGGISGLLGLDQRPRFREYAVGQRHVSYSYDAPLVVGGVLPENGVVYYEVPPEYGARGYRYTILNGRPVLVDPRTRQILEVID